MARQILDTSVLISFWKLRTKQSKTSPSAADAEAWAKELIELRKTNFIVTPILLEFIAGAKNREELELFKTFLMQFTSLDKRELKSEDWNRAQRYAERIPQGGKPRHLGDCLVKALAGRFCCSVVTFDLSFPRRN